MTLKTNKSLIVNIVIYWPRIRLKEVINPGNFVFYNL